MGAHDAARIEGLTAQGNALAILPVGSSKQ
jgi:hypothetical protein